MSAISSSRLALLLGVSGLVGAGSFVIGARADGPPSTSPLFYAGTIEENGTLTEGTVPIGVALFADADTTPPESRLCDIPSANRSVTRGRFRIDVSACLDSVSDNADVFVEVTVRGVPLPRQKLGAVPYALEAQRAQTAAIAEAVAGGAVDASALAVGAVTSSALASGSVQAGAIAAGAVSSNSIANSAVGSNQIANGAVSAADLGDGAVGSLQLANAGVATADLADAAVTAAKLAPNSVDGSRIVDRSIQGGDILQNSLGGDLLQSGSIEKRHAPFALSGAFSDGGSGQSTSNLVVFASTNVFTTQNVALSRHTISFGGVTFTRPPTCVVVNGDSATFFGGAMTVITSSTTGVEIGVREYSGQPVPAQIFRVNTICVGV